MKPQDMFDTAGALIQASIDADREDRSFAAEQALLYLLCAEVCERLDRISEQLDRLDNRRA